MKKLITLSAALLFIGVLTLTSCSSNRSLCPAYPPSSYQGDADTDTQNTEDVLIIEKQKNL
jgi:hypothetical protein